MKKEIKISKKDIKHWKKQYPRFMKALKNAATGFSYKEDIIEYDRSQHKYVKTKVKRFVSPNEFMCIQYLKLKAKKFK
jgi:hypothetical protein